VTCKAAERYRALSCASSCVILAGVLTVISWSTARRGRKALHELVQEALSDRPTLLAVLSDLYTIEEHIRPFAPLAERFAQRIDFIVAAEWPAARRESDGEALLQRLGLAPEARRRMLRDEGPKRVAAVLRQKQPVALVEVFFEERAATGLDGKPDPRGPEIREREDRVARSLEDLLGRLPPPSPPPPRTLKPGEHDFGQRGICAFCGQGRSTFLACTGTRRDDAPRRDRFELIELD